MQVSTEGTKSLQYSAPERVEAAPLPDKDEPGPSTRLSHHKTVPILKVYDEDQIRNGTNTAFAYLLTALNEDELEELLNTTEPEFKRKLMAHMPNLLDCDPKLMEAIKGRPYCLPINFRLLRQELNEQQLDYYQKQGDKDHLRIALYRSLALHLATPVRSSVFRAINSGQLPLTELPPEHLPDNFGSKTLTACLRDTDGKLCLDPEVFFAQLGLMARQGHFSKDCVENPDQKPKGLQNAMMLRMKELGLKNNIKEQARLRVFNNRLATIDNAEDLVLLKAWGQKHKIPDAALYRCDVKLARVMCSDLLIHVQDTDHFIEAEEQLDKLVTELKKPNLSDEDKGHIHTQAGESQIVKTLRQHINSLLAKDRIVATVRAYPYSGFARCYRALRYLGVANRSTSMQQLMQPLAVDDLLEQYVRDHNPENHCQTAEELQDAADAQKHCRELAPSVKLYSMPERDRKMMLERMNDCYKNDLPMPWQKEEQIFKPEPPSRISAGSFVSSVDLEEEDDVFS